MKKKEQWLIYEAFLLLKTKTEFKCFLSGIFYPSEICELEKRYLIFRLLHKKNLSYAAIAKKVGCSTTIVTRVSRVIKYEKNKVVLKVLKKHCSSVIDKNVK
jgi:uncharacterized protein YerC